MDNEICKECGGEIQISLDHTYRKCTKCGNMEVEEWAIGEDVW